MFDKTEVGHLTAPQRTGEGIEMIAICGRTASNDDTALRAQISERLLDAELQQDAARRLKELRSHAVIVKP
jgi:peptidyl-prolyl cis-trans isomerase SurA